MEKGLWFLILIKNIIINFWEITMLSPLEYQTKLNCIHNLYDVKERPVIWQR